MGLVTWAFVVARFRDLRGLPYAAREDGSAAGSPLRSRTRAGGAAAWAAGIRSGSAAKTMLRRPEHPQPDGGRSGTPGFRHPPGQAGWPVGRLRRMIHDAALPPGLKPSAVTSVEREGVSYTSARWAPDDLARLGEHLRTKGADAMAGISDSELLEAWSATVEVFRDPGSVVRQALDRPLSRFCRLSPEGLSAGLEAVLGGVVGESLERLLAEATEAEQGSRDGHPGRQSARARRPATASGPGPATTGAAQIALLRAAVRTGVCCRAGGASARSRASSCRHHLAGGRRGVGGTTAGRRRSGRRLR